MKIHKVITLFLFVLPLILSSGFVLAQDSVATSTASDVSLVINFFYLDDCPHCHEEQGFLDEMAQRYPQLVINRYNYNDSASQDVLLDLARKMGVERSLGVVPLTFVGNDFFRGFDFNGEIGAEIEQSIQDHLNNKISDGKINLPNKILQQLADGERSLFVTSILLGGLDGFNVCSLGALVLILGLVLAIKSRAKIALFGSIFVLTTAFAYGALIVLWFRIFSYFVGYLWIMDIALALLGIGGGAYFLAQFIKARKNNLVCEKKPSGVIHKASSKLQSIFENPKHILLTLAGVLFFALLVTIVEFPCSAVVPVAYAGLLAKSNLSTTTYLFYIALYILFYMLDEIIVLAVAIATMRLWVASDKFTKWAVLGEAIVLFALGFYYLLSIL